MTANQDGDGVCDLVGRLLELVRGSPHPRGGWLPAPAAEHLGETAKHLAAPAGSIAASETFARTEIED